MRIKEAAPSATTADSQNADREFLKMRKSLAFFGSFFIKIIDMKPKVYDL
ncbi:MAG: hypothetical protein AB1393_12930 [Candidatus Edwardsbacteria bacterium]